MTFEEILDQAIAMLERRGRVSYRALQRQFQLDDAYLQDLTAEIVEVLQLAVDQDRTMLVWTGGPSAPAPVSPPPPSTAPADPQALQPTPRAPAPSVLQAPEAERRQLTVLFCDLVDSTQLSSQLDPEELREVVLAYQATCAKVIARFEGHIAQYLGDGLLVYFGYPLAHEDDAQRAVRAGLGIVEALGQLNTRLAQERDVRLAVRLGIHTGLVVVGDVGGGTRQEQLALGETPNVAARLQGRAAPNTLVISAATFQLLGGFFACQPLGTPLLKGLAQPLAVYRVLYESMVRSRLEAAGSAGLTPLVGRAQEIRLLQERWAQVKDGTGQVVLLSGEAGIGKSRLVQVLKEQVATEPQAWLTPCQCSPYHQNTALYPWIDLLERVALRFEREESSAQKLRKLEGFLVQYGLPLGEAVPLCAALLSLPLPAAYAPLTLAPGQQKQQLLHTLLTILLRIAAQQPILFVMEDLHWVDPSTLELLSLLLDQVPTARILALWTFRPDFSPSWTGRAHLTEVTVHRLSRGQAVEVIRQVAHGKVLPPDLVEQIVTKTDGVPLFVEELTKMVLESGLLREQVDHYALTGLLPPLAIPATLHDSLMARLDRLAMVKGLAQLGATVGREFSYALLQAIAPWDEETVQRGLHQLVEAQFLYQQGLPPQATYLFKHALIQEAAYQSLLRSTRQQYHQRIAQVLAERFPETAETQPELVAHHYKEAGLSAQAIAYWQHAGQHALERSAYVEAMAHLTQALEALQTLPATPERARQELLLLTSLGPALIAIKGQAAPEVEQVYRRAQTLCEQLGETAALIRVLRGLGFVALVRGALQTLHDISAQFLALVEESQEPLPMAEAHYGLGIAALLQGHLQTARAHYAQSLAFAERLPHLMQAVIHTLSPQVIGHSYMAWTLWLLGYAEQAQQHSQAALTIARELTHPLSLAYALCWAAHVHLLRGEAPVVQALSEEALTLCRAQEFPHYLVYSLVYRGWVLATQARYAEGITQIEEGLATCQALGIAQPRAFFLGLLADALGRAGRADDGLRRLDEAQALMAENNGRWWEAEWHRLKGDLLLQTAPAAVALPRSAPPSASHLLHTAEACWQQALVVAQAQQARACELRAALSLSRLWQQQGKRTEAYELLAPIYGWFTEGFATADLQDAKALLEALP